MMETRTRGKGTIDHGLRGSVGTLDDMNPTRLSKRSQGCPLTHISNEAMRHISDNVEGAEKVCFSNKKHVCHGCALGKLHQCSFSENPKCSSETLGLIHSDLLELSTLSYSKYK